MSGTVDQNWGGLQEELSQMPANRRLNDLMDR